MRIQVLPPLVPDEPESGGASIGMGSYLDFLLGYLPQRMHFCMHVKVVVALVYRTY